MITKSKINDHIRDLILERKNRVIIANSVSSKKDFDYLYNFCIKNIEKDANEIDEVLRALAEEEVLLLNDMFQSVLNLCRSEWAGDVNPVEIIENHKLRKRCSLCNQPNNRFVFNIINKISGKKMNVGSTCIEQFPSIVLKDGKTRTQLEKEAEKRVRLQRITLKIPGIERTVLEWNNRLEEFNLLIPIELDKPYISLGEELKRIYEEYLKGKKDLSVIEKINDILKEKDSLIHKMNEYCNQNQGVKYVATRGIVNWLKTRRQNSVIEKLKETGFVSEDTASKIHEKNFIENCIQDINCYCDEKSIDINILGVDTDYKNFIIKPLRNNDLKLECSFEKFLLYFGKIIFKGKSEIHLNLVNVFKVSKVMDRKSLEIIILELNKTFRNTPFSISIYNSFDYDYYSSNEIDIFNKKTGKVYVLKLNKFINEYKTYTFRIKNITSKDIISDLEDYIDYSEHKVYTRKELRELRKSGREFNKREK